MTDGRRRVLIIGGKHKPLRRARELGLEVALIQDKKRLGKELAVADYAFVFDYGDPALLLPIARGIHRALPFRFALSFTEWGLEPAALVQEDLGLEGNPPHLARLLRDKPEMRRLLDQRGLSPVAWRRCSSAAEACEFMRGLGRPALIKPSDGTASRNVFKVADERAAEAACRALAADGAPGFIIEEFLDGPEVSVESVSAGGRHQIVAITDKFILPNFVEVGHVMPSRFEGEAAEEVARLTRRFLDAVGLAWGPAHTEVKLTAAGPRVVESHNRAAGDKITDLVNLAFGVDLYAMTYRGLFGLAGGDRPASPPLCAAAVRFLVAPPGLVREVRGVEAVAGHPAVRQCEVTACPGDVVREVRDSGDRLGHIIVTAPTAAEAAALSQELAARVEIITEPARADAG